MAKKPIVAVTAVEDVPVAKAPAETAEAKNTRIMQETIKAVVGELVPAMMALQQGGVAKAPVKEGRRWVQCRTCKQSGPGKAPCNDEHIKMVVYPVRYPEFGKWFQGAIINGIRYLSDGRRDRIDIPAACEGQIMKQVADYEENERITAMGRTAQHDSGSMNEGGGGNTKGANSAWR